MIIERIIELLEIEKECVLRNATGGCNRYCAKCGLLQDDTELHEMYTEVIALLQAQEPRVIQFDEIDDYEVLWLEVRDVETEDGLAPWVKTASGRWFSPLLCSEARPDMILSTPREYGRICRCWTSSPTDAQRAAEPWPKEEP